MSAPINLNKARKSRARAAAGARADANAAKHGRPKAARDAEMAERKTMRERLDGHRIARDEDR